MGLGAPSLQAALDRGDFVIGTSRNGKDTLRAESGRGPRSAARRNRSRPGFSLAIATAHSLHVVGSMQWLIMLAMA